MSGTIFFKDRRNLLKRGTVSGTVNMAAPTTGAYPVGGSPTLYVTNLTIPHGLGYPPVFRYYSEPFGDGVVWPPLTDRLQGRSFNPNNLAQDGPGIIAWVDSTNLYLQLFYINNSLTGTYPVYYVLYKDFSL